MQRQTVIKIDLCLLDEETGDHEFKAVIDREFIECFGIDEDMLKKDIDNLVDNIYENCSDREGE